ncbi:arginase family protein [Neobacillus terrae]|uniref:arginase family protein n=1 Tax=Neobacillus terrae TaxID=3034837 RepID=UPI00140D1770|nr:arginase family protein [Neobacillus terrae]NHM31031.1 arginase family protein [Neobacillus terrae]
MKVNIFGLPVNAGALYKGTEQSPDAIRKAGLVNRLREAGFNVLDHGNITEAERLPKHNISPVRNWPAPRMVWEATLNTSDQLFNDDDFTIILGGDCSIEVGTFSAFRKVFGEDVHLLVLDGHVDTVAPSGNQCVGAAGMGLWFLTQDCKVWWQEEPFPTECITVIGNHTAAEKEYGIKTIPFEEINLERVKQSLNIISDTSKILVHFDVDVLHKSVMPSAYSPSETGLYMDEASEILKTILADPRVKGLEVTEFSADKEIDGKSSESIIELLSLISEREKVGL